MDLWVVAAITGAGYAAKYLQNFSREREGFSGLMSRSSVINRPGSPSLISHIQDNTSSLQKSAQSDPQHFSDRGNRNLASDGRFGESTSCNSPSPAEIASTFGFQGDICDSSGQIYEAYASEMGTLYGPRRGRNSLRSRLTHLQHLKPLNSLESCLMAQLYKDHAEMEEHVLAPLPSPCAPVLRSFVVTDGTRVISRQSLESFSAHVRNEKVKVHMKAYPETNEVVFGGIPWLAERGSEGLRQWNLRKGKDQIEKLSNARGMANEMQMSPQGSPSGAALFCLGVSIGMMSSIFANKMEVTKLKDVLKQTEFLVQDLQEEIEMKDSLTVKELVSEGNIFPCEHEPSFDNKRPMMDHVQSDSEVQIKCGVEGSDTHKAPEAIDLMDQIEAELEAELERLELNMKGSALHANFSDDDELNTDILAEVIKGELRSEILSRKPTSDPSRDNGSSNSRTPCSPKQAVSPRELSLHLHQVMQSRLQQRIMELEAALEMTQKRVQQLELKQRLSSSWRHFSHDDASSSPSKGSPIAIDAGNPAEAQPHAQAEDELPLVMNLFGEALDAYNEAFPELIKIHGSENEEDNPGMYKESILRKHKQMEADSLLFQPTLTNVETLAIGSRTSEQWEKFSFNEDESKDDDDVTTLLIKQIVEKTRQGSPAILHAHRAMVSLDRNDK